MPAGPWKAFVSAQASYLNGAVGPSTTLRCVLLGSSYTPNQQSHGAWSNLSAHELPTGGGYAQDGLNVPVSHRAFPAGLNLEFRAVSDITFPGSTFTAKYAALVWLIQGQPFIDADDLPFCYCELEVGGVVTMNNGTLVLDLPGNNTILQYVCS